MDADCANDHKRVLLPFGDHGALATIPEASSSDSDDPCADDASDSSGRPEMRYDKNILGGNCFFPGTNSSTPTATLKGPPGGNARECTTPTILLPAPPAAPKPNCDTMRQSQETERVTHLEGAP